MRRRIKKRKHRMNESIVVWNVGFISLPKVTEIQGIIESVDYF